MTFQPDKIAGLIVATLGLVLLFVIFPVAIEDIEGGSIQPDTLPNVIAGFLVICGILLALKPGEPTARDPREIKMVLLYIAVMALGLFAMSHFGFVIVSPVLALVIMLLFGEQRPFWLASGCVGMPAVIWLLVVQILERPLP